MAEDERLAELHRYGILDTPPEAAFDHITRLAARLFQVPIALVSLTDRDRQWFKSSVGVDMRWTEREASFCNHALASGGPLVVPDARREPHFCTNPLVTGSPGIRFYAGAPLVTPRGHTLGMLSVVDIQPRPGLSPDELATLADLAALVMDQLELRRTSLSLREEKDRVRSLFDNMRRIVFCRGVAGADASGYDEDGLQLYGFDNAHLAGNADGSGRADVALWHQAVHPDDRPGYVAAEERRKALGEPYELEYRIIHPLTGELRWMQEHAWVVDAGNGRRYLDGYIIDVTEKKEAETKVRVAAERAALALAAGRMGTWEWEIEADRIVWDEAQCRLFGVPPDRAPVTVEGFFTFVHPDDRALLEGAAKQAEEAGKPFEGEYRIVRPDGTVIWVAEHGVGTLDAGGRMVRVIGVNYDITERKEAEARVRDLALRDALTGLPNRRMLQELLARDLAGARHTSQGPALMLVDLDDFKAVNDTLGHASGDALLIEAGQRLQACVRRSDMVARLGGDEFAVLTTPGADPGGLGALAGRLVSELGRPFAVGGVRVQLGGSVGVAVHSGEPGDVERLLTQADLALYAAKAAGRGTWRFFEPAMQERARQAVALDHDLRSALERGEFRLFFQPIVALGSLELMGFEALLRWQSPTRGLVAPADFLAAAERGRLMTPLTFWTLSEALAQAALWQREGLGKAARVSVNVAVSALAAGDLLVEHAQARLAAEGLPASALQLEITEEAIAGGGGSMVAVLERFRRAGIRVAIDDFGAGHSSLARLRQLPLDILKIDRAFLAGAGAREEAILRAIVELAASLDLSTVAEGIETDEQLSLLRWVGADAVQGYLLSRPMPAGEVVAWSRAWAASGVERKPSMKHKLG